MIGVIGWLGSKWVVITRVISTRGWWLQGWLQCQCRSGVLVACPWQQCLPSHSQLWLQTVVHAWFNCCRYQTHFITDHRYICIATACVLNFISVVNSYSLYHTSLHNKILPEGAYWWNYRQYDVHSLFQEQSDTSLLLFTIRCLTYLIRLHSRPTCNGCSCWHNVDNMDNFTS